MASPAALFSTHFVARLMRPDAEDAFPGQMMSQQELLGHALHHQAQISTIAQLEALRTPPREAERIFPALLEAEAEKFQCPVSVGVPGIAPSHPSRQIVKTLRRIDIMVAPDDAESEAAALEWAVAHRALSRGGIGFVSRPIDAKAFVWLDTLESLWAKGQQTPKTVWRCLERLSRVAQRSFMDVELAVLSHASSLTSFSEFPIGLMTLPYDTAPLCCRIPIAYRPLVPLTRTVQFELSPVSTTYLQGQLKVLVAECIPTDDIVGRISRRGWATAGRRVSEVANLTLHVREISSAAELRSALREDTYDLLVISAHGFVDRNQHRTGFLCGHERVVEEELGPLPPMVCFSACQVSPRGRGTTNITDLMFRQGAIVILGTLVPIDVRRNTVLMTRFFANIAEALQGKMPKNSFEAVWQFTMSSNAFNDILSSNTALAHWASERQEGQSVIEEFMLHRSRGRLRPGHIYQDTEAVLRDIAKDRGILNRFHAWMQSQGYIPESLFYAVLGWPERIVFYDAQYEKVFNQQNTSSGFDGSSA